MTAETADSVVTELDELTYFRRRAEDERQLAYGAKNQELASIHEKLAREYRFLIAQLEGRLLSDRARSQSEDRPLWHTDWSN